MIETKYRRREDRRQGQDLVLKLLTAFGVATALFTVAALLLLGQAKPHAFAEFDKEAFVVRSYWNPVYAQALFFVMLAGFALGLIGLLLNTRRLKRRSDSIRLNLVFLTAASALGMLVYLYYF
ncbi:MAG: hypothetical protein MUC50_18735 [Myxococcota bacterium]|jgi:ABC-type phosphate transport system permease subunit|nr:hypothetical protein [Myxococcota bacterium]